MLSNILEFMPLQIWLSEGNSLSNAPGVYDFRIVFGGDLNKPEFFLFGSKSGVEDLIPLGKFSTFERANEIVAKIVERTPSEWKCLLGNGENQ